jgi:hypothetical protein
MNGPSVTSDTGALLLAHAGHAEQGSVLPAVLLLLLLAGTVLLVAAAGTRRPDRASRNSRP